MLMQVGNHLPEAAWQDQSAMCAAMASCGETLSVLVCVEHRPGLSSYLPDA